MLSRNDVSEIKKEAKVQEAVAQALRDSPAATMAVALDNKKSELGKELQAAIDGNADLKAKLKELKGKHATLGEALMAMSEMPAEERAAKLKQWNEFSDALEAATATAPDKGKSHNIVEKFTRRNKVVNMTTDALQGDSPEAKAAQAKLADLIKNNKELQKVGETMGAKAQIQLALELDEEFKTLANKAIDAKQAQSQAREAEMPTTAPATPPRTQVASNGPGGPRRTPSGSLSA